MDLKAKHLIRALLGNARLDPDSPPISASTFMTVLEELGIAKSAVRAALNRMVEQGQLIAHRSGRTVSYQITESHRKVLEDARLRLFAAEPFTSIGPGWTLITVSVPESNRAHRHRLGSLLAWRGFAPLWNGLWIASGHHRIDELIANLAVGAGVGHVMAFEASREHPQITIAQAADLWKLEEVREAHDAFIERWENFDPTDLSPLALHTWLIGEWTQLIRLDPRLSTEYLPDDWPAERSVSVFQKSLRLVYESARNEFNALEPDHKPNDS